MYTYCNIKIESTPGSVPLFSFYAYQSWQSAAKTEPGSGSVKGEPFLADFTAWMLSMLDCCSVNTIQSVHCCYC